MRTALYSVDPATSQQHNVASKFLQDAYRTVQLGSSHLSTAQYGAKPQVDPLDARESTQASQRYMFMTRDQTQLPEISLGTALKNL